MNIFHLHAEKSRGGMRDAGTWLVVADSLFDAIALVPEGFCVKDVDIQVAAVAGPVRVIGCFAVPPMRQGGDKPIVNKRRLRFCSVGQEMKVESWIGYQRTGSGF